MSKRNALVVGLFGAVGLVQLPLIGGAQGAPSVRAEVPAAVREAAAQGRYWRASRLLGDHMAAQGDSAPELLLLAARLSAGWGDWSAVAKVLEGRSWLDDVGGGAGWGLLGRARIELGDPAGGSDALARYLAVAELGQEARGLVELRRGLALSQTEGRDDAQQAFDRAIDLVPWFADWASFLAAEGAARVGDLDRVNERLAAAGGVGGGSWRLRVTAGLAAGDTMAGREAALAATRTGSRSDRSEAWAELGRLRLAAGDRSRARAAFVRAMEVRTSAGAVEAARRLSEMDPSPQEWRLIAAVYQSNGNAARAADGFERFLATEEGTAGLRAQTRLELARARFAAGHYRQAERELLELAEADVPSRVAAEAMYLLARSQYRQGRSTAGEATFQRLAERFPHEDASTRGLYLLADLKHDDQDTDGPEGARAFYRQAADGAPHLNEAGLALMRLAGLEYLEGDYQSAAAIWEGYRERYPDGRRIGQATYWAARSYERLGQRGERDERLREVRRVDPISFYGMRAAEELDRPLLDLPMTESPARDPASDSLVADGLRRVDLLAELERRDDLVEEVERLRRRFQAVSGPGAEAGEYALAESLNARGYTLTGIGMGRDLYRRSGTWNPRLLRIVYPFPYRNLIVPEARDRGLDPYLVAGLIRQESAFSPVVASGAGALGLMQIVPATGRVLASGAGIRPFRLDLLTRPEVNVHLGTRFFAELWDRFDRQLPLVLAAYNAGPTRAAAWRQLPEAADPELFMERIPYGETRDYVRNVLVNRALYQALYPDLAVGSIPGPAPLTPASSSSP